MSFWLGFLWGSGLLGVGGISLTYKGRDQTGTATRNKNPLRGVFAMNHGLIYEGTFTLLGHGLRSKMLLQNVSFARIGISICKLSSVAGS